MIVTSLNEGWEIVYQRSHALLSAQMLASWQEKYHPKRWTETLIAVAQHDDQENYWGDTRHLTDLGAPLDFTQETTESNTIKAKFVIENAERQGIWIALLISRHNHFLHHQTDDKQMQDFLAEQEKKRRAWLGIIDISEAELERTYTMMRWADRLSLILCRRQLPERERWLEICEGPDGERHEVMQREDKTVNLRPWVLDTDEIDYSIEVRKLKQLKFESEDAFKDAVMNAEVEHRVWTFKKF